MWTHRIMLETLCHSNNCFVTLTYADENLPLLPDGQMTLKPSDLVNFLKRLRSEIAPSRIRFYATGEYGDEGERPHYHAAVFGLDGCARGISRYRKRPDGSVYCCPRCTTFTKVWGNGLAYLGTLETNSAQYIAGYVTKKMTHKDDARLNGRYPEFARMSLRPGIGANAMAEVADTLHSLDLDKSQADVPVSLRHGSRTLPLGRYLRQQLRMQLGKDAKAPQETINQQAETMRPLLEAAKLDKENPSLRSQIVIAGKGGNARLEALSKIRKTRKIL